MSDLADRIAQIQQQHMLMDWEGRKWWCKCGDDCLTVEGSHSAHVAAAIVAELERDQMTYAESNYADHLCPGGCDCSCCYGYQDKTCYHFVDPCNCGMTKKEHGR